MKKDNPLVVTVAVHYNSPQDCINMLASLDDLTYPYHKIIVVDNCSSTSAYALLNDYIRSNFSSEDCELINNSANVGFGGGINFGVEYASKYSPTYIHVINTDAAVINPYYVSDLVSVLEQDETIGIVGPGVLKENREIQNTILPFVTLTSAVNFKKSFSKLSFIDKNPRLLDVECVNGVCFVTPYLVFKTVGGFDPSYFMYGEEQDLCFAIAKAGYRRVFWSGASIVHYGAEKEASEVIDWRYVHVRKNQIRFLRKFNSVFKASTLALLFSASLLLKSLRGRCIYKGETFGKIIKNYFLCAYQA